VSLLSRPRLATVALPVGIAVGFGQAIRLMLLPIVFEYPLGYGQFLALLAIAPFAIALFLAGPISGILMILVGFSGGTEMGLYCIIVYVVVQTVDGNVIVPMIAKKTADLAPALVLGAQLIMGALFGILGLLLADPLVALIKIALERHSDRNEPAAGANG